MINVHRDGKISLDRKVLTVEQLTAELKNARRQTQDVGVIVRGDGAGEFQNVATVLNACRQAGISDLGISVSLAKRDDATTPAARR